MLEARWEFIDVQVEYKSLGVRKFPAQKFK